jgi:hypothetical protein
VEGENKFSPSLLKKEKKEKKTKRKIGIIVI